MPNTPRHSGYPTVLTVKLGPGDIVKCAFEAPEGSDLGGERMWIIVKEVRDDGTYLGELNSHPMFIDAKAGDYVSFRPEHVIDILRNPVQAQEAMDAYDEIVRDRGPRLH
jgi:hypothetical protein